jgi:uncharacterized protein YecE (DUF72 family)
VGLVTFEARPRELPKQSHGNPAARYACQAQGFSDKTITDRRATPLARILTRDAENAPAALLKEGVIYLAYRIRRGRTRPTVGALLPFLEMDLPRDALAAAVSSLAEQGVYVGTSSWKYEGWLGLIYNPDRYRTHTKFSRTKFERTCLTEYAKVFKTVCVDAGFYQFPTAKMLDGYFSHVSADFRLSIKVTEDITVKRFSTLPRYGMRAGQINERFLDADLFIGSFLAPLEPYRGQMGALIFEFSHFHPGDWERGRQFVEALDEFFAMLPKGWNYSVEVRNPNLLQPEYFEVLRQHGVAHTFNSWSRMPSVTEQLLKNCPETFDFASSKHPRWIASVGDARRSLLPHAIAFLLRRVTLHFW